MSEPVAAVMGTAVITGAGNGIGRGLAVQAAKEGYTLAICDVAEAGLRATEAGVVALGAPCTTAVFDIRDRESFARFATDVPGPISLVFANAGVLREGLLVDMTRESLQLTVDVNLMAVLDTIAVFLPRLRAQEPRSRILITGSQASYGTPPQLGMYAATKQAVRAIAETLRAQFAEAGEHIDISLIAPSSVASGIFDRAHTRDLAGEEERVETVDHREDTMTSAEAAEVIFDGIRAGRFLIGTQYEILTAFIDYFHARVLDDLAGAKPPAFPGGRVGGR